MLKINNIHSHKYQVRLKNISIKKNDNKKQNTQKTDEIIKLEKQINGLDNLSEGLLLGAIATESFAINLLSENKKLRNFTLMTLGLTILSFTCLFLQKNKLNKAYENIKVNKKSPN